MHIIVTIGPATSDDQTLRALVREGATGFRFSLSKGSLGDHARLHARLKEIALEEGARIWTMADLPAGKPRLSNGEPIAVVAGLPLKIAVGLEKVPGADLFVSPPLPEDSLHPGDLVAIGDGENQFRVESVEPGAVHGSFVRSGELERIRAFLPARPDWRVPTFTPRDRELAEFAREAGFDALALSYVHDGEDLDQARSWLKEKFDWSPILIAKVETDAAVQNINLIADSADQVMVARGDLGVQLGMGRLWHAERRIVAACVAGGTPVIVATGFLDGMSHVAEMSRSEAIDIGTALFFGADALMLSGETSVGPRPLEAVRALKETAAIWAAEEAHQGLPAQARPA